MVPSLTGVPHAVIPPPGQQCVNLSNARGRVLRRLLTARCRQKIRSDLRSTRGRNFLGRRDGPCSLTTDSDTPANRSGAKYFSLGSAQTSRPNKILSCSRAARSIIRRVAQIPLPRSMQEYALIAFPRSPRCSRCGNSCMTSRSSPSPIEVSSSEMKVVSKKKRASL